jgi:hypothetical protein
MQPPSRRSVSLPLLAFFTNLSPCVETHTDPLSYYADAVAWRQASTTELLRFLLDMELALVRRDNSDVAPHKATLI